MFYINITKKEIDIFTKDSGTEDHVGKYKKIIFGKETLYIIGHVCEPNYKKIISNLYSQFGSSSKNLFHEIFINVDGKYSIVIRNEEGNTFIAPSYDMHCLYLYRDKVNNKYRLTDFFEKIDEEAVNKDNLYARIFNGPNGFSLLSSNVEQIIIPGMMIEILSESSENNIIEEWVMPLHKIASRSDHETIAQELADKMSNSIENYAKHFGISTYLNLSGGIDSALMAAAAKSRNSDIKYANHFHHYLDNDNFHAIDIASKLGIEINIFPYQASHHLSSRYDNTDWREIISDYVIPAHKFNINSSISPGGMSLTLPFLRNNAVQLEGNSYPVSLCIQHCCVYPQLNPLKEFFLKLRQKKRRYQYSDLKCQELMSNQKNRRSSRLDDNIHPYYDYAFSIIYDRVKLNYELEDSSSKKNDKFLKNFYKDYIEFILRKILINKEFSKKLNSPCPETLQKLIKLIAFIDGPMKGACSLPLNLKGFERFNIGNASSISYLLLTTKFDELLINNSKWHIFRAFEILAGFSFLEEYKKCMYQHSNDLILQSIKAFLSKHNFLRERYEKEVSNHNELLKNQTNLKYYFKYIDIKKSKLLELMQGTDYFDKLNNIYINFDKDKTFLYKNVDYATACNIVSLEIFLDK